MLKWIAAGVMGMVMTTSAIGCSPDMVQMSVNDSRDYLRRAARADSVDDAQSAARRAQSSLGDVEMYLMSCNCYLAVSDFSEASTYARRARNEDNPSDLSDYLRRAIRAFNSGVDNIRLCRR
jgi:hypothetical protein